MKVELVDWTVNPQEKIELAASNCYDSIPNGKIMKSCYKSGHHSVLEFADFTFHIEGVSRALLALITRHRVASFAVRSQRYCNEDGFNYVVPSSIKSNEDALAQFKSFMNMCQDTYSVLQYCLNEQSLGNVSDDIREITESARKRIRKYANAIDVNLHVDSVWD